MAALRIPVTGDRMKKARAEVSTLSDDAVTYLFGVALVALNENLDESEVPESKEKLLHIIECLQGPSEIVPPHIPPKALENAIGLLQTFMDHLPDRSVPRWNN